MTAITLISLIYLSVKSNQVNMNVSKCGIAKASNEDIDTAI